MNRLFFAVATLAAFSLAAFAQTPTPPARPATGNAAPTAAPVGGTGAEGKLAYINNAKLGDGINELREKMDALAKEFEPKRKEVQALEEEVNNIKNKIQTQGPSVSAQVKNQWMEEGATKEKQLKRKAEDYTADGQKRQMEIQQPILEKIMKFMDSYCQQRGIAMLMEAGAAQQSGVLVWAVTQADITDDFIKEYNKVNPGSGAAAPKK